MKLRALVAEFVGTFALVYVGMLAIATDAAYHDINRVGVALAFGLTIAVMASAVGAISGGHFNPAVSVGIWLAKKITFARMIGYSIAQFAGAIVGAYIAYACTPTEILMNGNFSNASYGVPSLHSGLIPERGLPTVAILIEVILTFFLMYVILGTAVDRRAPKMAGLFIGLTVTLDIFAGGPLTGASMNPARWFGPALLVSNQGAREVAWANWQVYTFAPLIGVALAVFLYGKRELADA